MDFAMSEPELSKKNSPSLSFYWHIPSYHNLVGVLMEPIEQLDVNTRLRMRPVRGALPAPVVEAGLAVVAVERAYDDIKPTYYASIDRWILFGKHRRAYVVAWRAFAKALLAFTDAVIAHKPTLEALHALECPSCPNRSTSKGGSRP